jgi:hypothetical protein
MCIMPSELYSLCHTGSLKHGQSTTQPTPLLQLMHATTHEINVRTYAYTALFIVSLATW